MAKNKSAPTESMSEIEGLLETEINNLAKGKTEFDDDEELELGDLTIRRKPRSVEAAQRIQGENVIDELLSSVPRNQGFYLKLYKEIRPNEFELKLRIDNYESWSDMELEVTNIVRSYTEKLPIKWGTGKYRVVIFRDGGLRGKRWTPIDFAVDAMEPPNATNNDNNNNNATIDPAEMLRSQMAALAEMQKLIQGNSNGVDPTTQVKLLAETYQQGVQAKGVEANNSNNLMTTLITALVPLFQQSMNKPQTNDQIMIELIKGMMINNRPEPKEDALAMLIKMREAGIINQNNNNGLSQTMETIQTLLPLMTAIGGNNNGGGETSIGMEVIKSVGPQLGKIVSDLTSAISSVASSKRNSRDIAPTNRRERIVNEQPVEERTTYQQYTKAPPEPITEVPASNPTPNINEKEDNMGLLPMLPILKKLLVAINANDITFYGELERLLEGVTTQEEYAQIIEGKVPLSNVVDQLISWGGNAFSTPVVMDYFEAFRQHKISQYENMISAECKKCNILYDFDNDDDLIKHPNCEECSAPLAKFTEDEPTTDTEPIVTNTKPKVVAIVK